MSGNLSDGLPRSHPSRRRLNRRLLLRMSGKRIATEQATAHPEAAFSQRPSRGAPATSDGLSRYWHWSVVCRLLSVVCCLAIGALACGRKAPPRPREDVLPTPITDLSA